MTHRKKLIEVALPLEAINVASAREKSIRHGHPSTLHLWWARRPLAAARAVIFTSLVDDPDDPAALPEFVEACKQLPIGANVKTNGDTPRMRLFDFIERLVTWEATTDEAILNTARELIQIATEGNPPPLLDPFAGGGSIPLEAQRLGLEAHASDLNPVAVMINKAQIEIPPRFANMPPVNPRDNKPDTGGDAEWRGAAGLAADVRYYGEWMRERAWERIGHLYPKHNGETVIAWIWARTVKSPNPAINAYVPLVRSFWLSKKKGNEAWIESRVDPTSHEISFIVHEGKGKPVDGTVSRSGGYCIITNTPITFEYIKDEAKQGRLGLQLMAIITQGEGRRKHYSPSDEQSNIALSAEPAWSPSYEMSTHPQYMAPPRYGMTKFDELFTKRQLTALSAYTEIVSEVEAKVLEDAIASGMVHDNTTLESMGNGANAYAQAIGVYFVCGLGRLADYCSTLSTWSPSRDQLAHVFTRQSLSMTWDFAESNVFAGASGDLFEAVNTVSKVIPNGYSDGFVVQRDARDLESNSRLVISTDPPYYDNVPYADLSDYFYVWMRRAAQEFYPDIFSTMLVPKSLELVADHQRLGGRDQANKYFEDGMIQVFTRALSIIHPTYPTTVYYAFKQADIEDESAASTGWETVLEGLINAGFLINGTWPIRTERSSRTRSIGANALASSIVLVCRPRPEDAPSTSRRAFVDTLRRELPAALKNMQSGNIAPVDLAQASIGPGMAIYSRYSQVLEADGTPMSVRTALVLINQELDAYLSEQEGDVDSDTRFAISWFEQFGFEAGEFGQADVLARAKNTSVAGVEAAGLVESGRGKVRLTHWSEYDPGLWNPSEDKRPTVWEATHHLIERLNSHGETGAAMLINKMPPDMAAEARQLAYRLYSICERKNWADHARDYNALVISWSGIGEEGARLREATASGQATQQPRLFGDE